MKKNFAALSRKVSKWVVAPLASVGLMFGAIATPANAATSYTELPGTNLIASITNAGYKEFNINLSTGSASSIQAYSLTYSPAVSAILSTTFDYQNQQILILAETNTTPKKIALYKLSLASRAGSSISLTGTVLTRSSTEISSQFSSNWDYRVAADNSGNAYYTEYNGGMSTWRISSLNLSTGVASNYTQLTGPGNSAYQCVTIWNTGTSEWNCWHKQNSELYVFDPATAVIATNMIASASSAQMWAPEFDSSGNLWGVAPGSGNIRSVELPSGVASNNPYSEIATSELLYGGLTTVIRLPATAPIQTTGLSATAGDSQVALSWSAPSNGGAPINDYVIEKSANGSSGWTTVADGTSTLTNYTVTGLTNGTISYFRVSARNSVGTGTASANVSATPTAPVVSTPSSSTPSASSSTPAVAASTTDAAAATKTYSSKPIDFSLGTSSISDSAKKNLKATVAAAGKNGKFTITGSAGQTTGVSDKAVKALAKKRANILKAYLVKLGVSKSSITIKTKVVKQGKKPKASVLALY